MEVAIKPDQLGRRQAFAQQKRSQPYFPVASHAPVWRVLRSSIVRGEGVICVVGAEGSGKSLLLHRLQGILPENRDMTLFDTPDNNTVRFLELLIRAIDPDWESLSPNGLPTSEDLIGALEKRAQTGRKLLIAVDQAHLLTSENASLLELSTRFIYQEFRPLQTLLCGTYDLLDLLGSPPYLPLEHLLIGTGDVTPLTRSEVWDYIHFHLKKNWGDHYRVSWVAWVEIFSRSQGNPGHINEILNQVAALLKVRPQKVISRGLVCRAVDGEPETQGFLKRAMRSWIIVVCLLTLTGWLAVHFVRGFSLDHLDAVRQVTEIVKLENVLPDPVPLKKNDTVTPETKETPQKQETTGSSSRVIYSPVSPPGENSSHTQAEPWVPRERRNSAENRAEHQSPQVEPAPQVESSPVPIEKSVPPSHVSPSTAIQPAPPPPTKQHDGGGEPRSVSSVETVSKDVPAERKEPLPSPKVHEPNAVQVAKQTSQTAKIPIPVPVLVTSVSPIPIPKPWNRTASRAKTPASPDPIGQSVAAIIEETAVNFHASPTSPPLSSPIPRPTKSNPPPPKVESPQGMTNPPPPALAGGPNEAISHKQPVGNVAEGAGHGATPLVSEQTLRAAGQLFVVQTGSFLNRENAERLASVLAEKGLDPYVHLLVKDNKKWFSVRVNYRDSKTAIRMAEQVKKDVGMPTQVIDLFYE
ncbi:MAG: AAA family ATPase [Nitrospirae bacterium]|nr:AAA family ATPase [Magnetococcales bacterium]